MEGQTKRANSTANSETITVPATSRETQDAIDALLLLGNPPEESLPGPGRQRNTNANYKTTTDRP